MTNNTFTNKLLTILLFNANGLKYNENELQIVLHNKRKWRFKINQSKSIHTTFTLRLSPCPEIFIYGAQIPTSSTVKYLGLTLNRRLTWLPILKLKDLI
jgi:hypothetical protein